MSRHTTGVSLRLALLLSCVICLDVRGQVINTVAGGVSIEGRAATLAELGNLTDVAVDSAGNLYIADPLNHRIRRVDAVSRIITTVAGTGQVLFPGTAVPPPPRR